jgi:hypothetical protein
MDPDPNPAHGGEGVDTQSFLSWCRGLETQAFAQLTLNADPDPGCQSKAAPCGSGSGSWPPYSKVLVACIKKYFPNFSVYGATTVHAFFEKKKINKIKTGKYVNLYKN